MTTHKAVANKRSWARRCAVQALYQWQLTAQDPASIVAHFIADQDLRKADSAYFQELTQRIPTQVQQIDAALQPFLDRPVAQVDPVEQAILRVGGYELMQRPELGYRIIINEAVELAKLLGAEQGHRFVNGVLDKLAQQVRNTECASNAD